VPTIVVTGSASGIGAATRAHLGARGARVIGVDLHRSDVDADLGTPEGRLGAVRRIGELAGGSLDGVVTCAGLTGLPSRPGSLLVSVNYFGTVELLEGLRPLLVAGERPAAVAISSNSTTTHPAVPQELAEACLAGDEAEARRLGDAVGSLLAYPATKVAVARFVRRKATTPEWIGAGITLNAIAPGVTDTPMVAETERDPVVGRFLESFPVPAGRRCRPDEIAALVAFLLGPDARFFVGSVVFADGGSDALLRPDDWPAPMPRR
jgi:NAD(P)-dependent dehydrogenase (short-subunit alcohol dehydrogenase family)